MPDVFGSNALLRRKALEAQWRDRAREAAERERAEREATRERNVIEGRKRVRDERVAKVQGAAAQLARLERELVRVRYEQRLAAEAFDVDRLLELSAQIAAIREALREAQHVATAVRDADPLRRAAGAERI